MIRIDSAKIHLWHQTQEQLYKHKSLFYTKWFFSENEIRVLFHWWIHAQAWILTYENQTFLWELKIVGVASVPIIVQNNYCIIPHEICQ